MLRIAALIKVLSTHFPSKGLVLRINFIYFYVKLSFVEKYFSNKNYLDKNAFVDLSNFLEIYSEASVVNSRLDINLYRLQFLRN